MADVRETEIQIPIPEPFRDCFAHFEREVSAEFDADLEPIRFVVNRTTDDAFRCEVGMLEQSERVRRAEGRSIFEFRRREFADESSFNAVFLVPTGIGCEIGGHAGDANAAAKLVGGVCDTLITHPNVVNASDVNEMPDNGLYVEGSIITRLMMGTAALRPVRSNRVLTVMDAHDDEMFRHVTLNSVSAARASFGMTSAGVVALDPSIRMESTYAPSGRAVGEVDRLQHLFDVLDERAGTFDAVALSTAVQVPEHFHLDYFESAGEMINPWGGVEAMLTHAISHLFDVPAAHAPMELSRKISALDPGEVDPRMAAEAISTGYFLCALKGLQRSPDIVADPAHFAQPGLFSARDISCLVIPDKCVGLPTLAALEQNIPVVAVAENDNIMENDLDRLPWREGQFHRVDNYWEAAGVLQALRSGLDPASVRRPLERTPHEVHASGTNPEHS